MPFDKRHLWCTIDLECLSFTFLTKLPTQAPFEGFCVLDTYMRPNRFYPPRFASARDLNTRLMRLFSEATAQFGLGVFYMVFMGINIMLAERGINSGLILISAQADISPYYLIVFCGCMSLYCLIRDRLPIHYTVGAIPILVYGVYLLFATLSGDFVLQGLIAVLVYILFAYVVIVGVISKYQLKNACKEIDVIKNDVQVLKQRLNKE